jgi:hypothetical protein
MLTQLQQIDSLQDLREYVNNTMCEQYQLQIGAFCMTERTLLRSGKPCGVYFCLHGPRLTRFTAIWENERNQILFYGSQGERVLKVQLVESHRLKLAAA